MDTAALIAWTITALGGIYLLGTWLIRGGMRQRKTGATSFPAALIFGHFLLAASGLASWITYFLTDITGFAWTALIALLLVAVLGSTMFVRWGGETEQADAPSHPSAPGATTKLTAGPGMGRATVRGAGPGRDNPPGMKGGVATTKAAAAAERPAESHFPIAVVAAHGGFAVGTLILVLLATLGVGG
jgi:hypothetical protein